MTGTDLLADGFGRVKSLVHDAVEGLSPDELAYRVDPDANSIAWLVWHLTRVQDDHVADAAQLDQVWIAGSWAEHFGLPFEKFATGYGHSSKDVAAVRADPDDLAAYHDAVHAQTERYLAGLAEGDFDRIVDTHWDPPVTLGVRLVSVLGDNMQHVGQAAYVRGVVARR